jgi:pimeloyl-ACP methyl ester carboxylesterase
VPAVSESHPQLAIIEAAFRSLPERYLGADPGFDRTFHIRLRDVGRTWEVRATEGACRVRNGLTRHAPDVTITTDAQTWQELREGQVLGVQAYRERRLAVRGNLDAAIAFEGLFRLPNGRPPLQQVRDVHVGRDRISVLSMGAGPPALLLHGLGATRASFFETAAAMSSSYTVHALDLPGFGSSSKPLLGAYDPRWFAEAVKGAMDELGVARAHFVGNSMGGRVAIEIGLRWPERLGGLGLLCPGVAWVKRDLHPIVRLLRPELGLLPHSFSRDMIERQFWALFADRDRVDPSVADVVVGEFQRIYGSAGARHAFLASARNIYLERPFGAGGFYPRLSALRPPALFVWGTHDPLIPAGFSRHVREWLPSAEQIVLDDCGHVPQVERPEQTNGLLMRFFARVDALGGPAALPRVARAA